MYICRQHSAGTVVSRSEDRPWLPVLLSFFSCPACLLAHRHAPHERPRRASTTRRVTAGGRTGLFAESQSSVGNVGGRLFATGRGSYDKAGYVGMGFTGFIR